MFHDHLSWLTWVDEDEVGLKEKPQDIRYIKKITSKSDPKHRECRQRNEIIGRNLGEYLHIS